MAYRRLLGLLVALPAVCQNPCASCHPKEVEGYAASGMARSVGRPIGHPEGRVVHDVSGSRFTIDRSDTGMRHGMVRGGRVVERNIPYFVGSGRTGRSYLASVRGYLFQSPVSYYTARGGWAMSPGFDDDPSADFGRPVEPGCLLCHAGSLRPVAGTRNRYQNPPFGSEAISCDRCHGSAGRHLAKPSRETIVNPVRLRPRARASVCEQCHVAGEVRVPNPGLSLADFRPGMELEDVWTVYTLEREQGAAASEMNAASHAELLALSVCAQASNGSMWCGTCHNPHETPDDPKRYFRKRCIDCHGVALFETHAPPTDDCVRCHMPRRDANNVAHSALTDHEILRSPREKSGQPRRRRLTAWREPAARLRQRNFGLASIEIGERYRYDAAMKEGMTLLAAVRERSPEDTELMSAMARALYGQRRFADSAALLEAAIAQDPDRADHHLHLGSVYMALGKMDEAVKRFELAIELDPGREDAYRNLAALFQATDRPKSASEVIRNHNDFLEDPCCGP